MKVIDVSGWQEDLDYQESVNSGVEGVIIKISEGTTFEETYWHHKSKCEEYGLAWGVYCFGHATTESEARAEANEVLYLLEGNTPPLGIWYDVEAPEMFDTDTTALASAFIVTCNEAGQKCGIYTSALKCTTDMLNSLRPMALADYVPWWIAYYANYSDLQSDWIDLYPGRTLAGWQYSDQEYIGDTNVDMNNWYI